MFARHQLSATTATASSSRTTRFTPAIPSAGVVSTVISFAPFTGAIATAAWSMPGSVKSMPYIALPSTFERMSNRCRGVRRSV